MKKVLGILAIIFFAAALYVWFFVYNKPHVNVKEATPVLSVDDETFLHRFTENPAKMDSLLQNQIIEIKSSHVSIIDKDTFQIVRIQLPNYIYSIDAQISEKTEKNQKAGVLRGVYVGYLEAEEDFGLDGSIQLERAVFMEQ